MSVQTFLCIESGEILKRAVHAVLGDDGFQVPSPSARKALETAKHLLVWCDDPANVPILSSFAEELVALQSSCFKASSSLSANAQRENLWGSFHRLRSSSSYKAFWSRFLQSRECESDPIFFQYVSDSVFKELVKKHYPLSDEGGEQPQQSLSYEEKNALRYTAGYIPRALRKKVERCNHPLMEELVLCLVDLTEGEEDQTPDESTDWVNSVDRGGLKHVTNMTYMVIASMELEVKKHLSLDATKYPPDIKRTLTDALTNNEDVNFYWVMLSANWEEEESKALLSMIEEEESKALLSMIIDFWITIRGFAFTSAWMERYKQTQKKTVQKSKGIRKTLISSKK